VDFVRVPHVFAETIIAHVKTGKELLALEHITLKNMGIAWGLASHIKDGIDQLRAFPNGVFAPVFVDARPYLWPFNGWSLVFSMSRLFLVLILAKET
jgi:hypothetical protein